MANFLSISRIVAGVALLGAAWFGATHLVLGLFGYALLTDAVDGRVARALGTVSERGAQLDSVADCVIYLTMPCVAWLLFPVMRERETVRCALVFFAYALPITYGFAKYGRLTSYHTIAAKVAAVLLSITFFLLLATHVVWPFHVAVAVLVLSALEEVAITSMLSSWRADVPSFRAALRSVRT